MSAMCCINVHTESAALTCFFDKTFNRKEKKNFEKYILNSVNSNLSAMMFIIYCTLHYTLCYRSGPSLVRLGHGVPPKTGSSIRIVSEVILKYYHAFQHNLKSFCSDCFSVQPLSTPLFLCVSLPC